MPNSNKKTIISDEVLTMCNAYFKKNIYFFCYFIILL